MKKKNWPVRQDSEDNRNLAFNYSLKYLSFRNRSVKEIKDYLLRKNFIDETINSAIEKLKNLKFVDDEEFAKSWIDARQRNKGKSKFILKQELRIKGIDNQMIDQTLKSAQDDLETARIAFDKKKKILNTLPPIEFKKKMSGFLQRKGYSWEIISKLFKE